MTEHELALKDKAEYNAFLNKLAEIEAPIGLTRWFNDVIMMFENDFEEILAYGETYGDE